MAARVKPLILMVEDDSELSESIEKQLQVSGMDGQKFHNADDALRFLQHSFSNLMLLDLNLHRRDALSLLENLKKGVFRFQRSSFQVKIGKRLN
jgi:DNA-binding response OmpR family regulator